MTPEDIDGLCRERNALTERIKEIDRALFGAGPLDIGPSIGDLVLVHGIVGDVVEKVGKLGFMFTTRGAGGGETIAYNIKCGYEPAPKRIWICEQ